MQFRIIVKANRFMCSHMVDSVSSWTHADAVHLCTFIFLSCVCFVAVVAVLVVVVVVLRRQNKYVQLQSIVAAIKQNEFLQQSFSFTFEIAIRVHLDRFILPVKQHRIEYKSIRQRQTCLDSRHAESNFPESDAVQIGSVHCTTLHIHSACDPERLSSLRDKRTYLSSYTKTSLSTPSRRQSFYASITIELVQQNSHCIPLAPVISCLTWFALRFFIWC